MCMSSPSIPPPPPPPQEKKAPDVSALYDAQRRNRRPADAGMGGASLLTGGALQAPAPVARTTLLGQ